MIFHSLDFIFFLTISLLLYWRLSHRYQNVLILISSYFFYGYVHPWFLWLIVFSTVVAWKAGRLIETDRSNAKRWLKLGLILCFIPLFIFKYLGFFTENVAQLLSTLGAPSLIPVVSLALPVGISFFTFQAASYIIDVYRREIEATESLLEFAAYKAFFPQLVAGPIERATTLLPRIHAPRKFDPEDARGALALMAWGFFKKMVIADNSAVLANRIFAFEDPPFPILWAGVLAFGVQIYADFSAYTDIARGTARLFGLRLMENFNHPYIATSPADFWRRWHISLSTWFRDYVYIPLGGSKFGELVTARNIVLTFLLSGLWHGASWNFVLWGLYYGVLLVLTRLLQRITPQVIQDSILVRPLQIATTFVLIHIGWLIFRETNLEYLIRYITLSPFGVSKRDWMLGAHFGVTASMYSIPLWTHALFDGQIKKLLHRLTTTPWRLTALETAFAGACFSGVVFLHSLIGADFIYFAF